MARGRPSRTRVTTGRMIFQWFLLGPCDGLSGYFIFSNGKKTWCSLISEPLKENKMLMRAVQGEGLEKGAS